MAAPKVKKIIFHRVQRHYDMGRHKKQRNGRKNGLSEEEQGYYEELLKNN